MGALRDAAAQAWQQERDGISADARAALGTVLSPFDVSTLTVAGEQDAAWIFTDGDLYLAVTPTTDGKSWSVWLVRDDAGWTRVEQITSLADLGEHMPPPPTPSVPDWAPQTVYAVGDHVLYQGVEYVCQQAHTSQVGWEPPAVPALWVRV